MKLLRTDRSRLVVGHSHVSCIRAAVNAHPDFQNVRVLNLGPIIKKGMKGPEIAQTIVARVNGFNPDALCLTLRGNYHNVLGITENPVPFSVGEKLKGVAPNISNGRHFIPYALMAEMFENYTNGHLAPILYDACPNAIRMYLNPPPPIPDFDHIRRNPGIFREMLDLGPSPNELKMHLYRIQTNSFRKLAESQKAIFIEPDSSLLDADGFLAPKYFDTDPTHGNTLYGKAILTQLLELADQTQ